MTTHVMKGMYTVIHIVMHSLPGVWKLFSLNVNLKVTFQFYNQEMQCYIDLDNNIEHRKPTYQQTESKYNYITIFSIL